MGGGDGDDGAGLEKVNGPGDWGTGLTRNEMGIDCGRCGRWGNVEWGWKLLLDEKLENSFGCPIDWVGTPKAVDEPNAIADVPAHQDKGEAGSFCWIGEFEEVVALVGGDMGVGVTVDVEVDDRLLGLDFPEDDAGLLANFRGCMKWGRYELNPELAEESWRLILDWIPSENGDYRTHQVVG